MNTKKEDLKTHFAIGHEQKKPFKYEICKGNMETLAASVHEKRDSLNLKFVTKIVLTTVMPLAGGQGGTLGVQLK